MGSKPDNRLKFSSLERKLFAAGHTVVINHFVPDGVVIEKPPNKLLEKRLPIIKNSNPDTTMSPRAIRLRRTLVAIFITAVLGLFLFMTISGTRRDYKAYNSLKPDEVTEVKGMLISEATILETYSQDDPPALAGKIFGNRKVRVGDKVGYNTSDNNLVDMAGKSRNFNTPLVIVSGKGMGFGSRSYGDKLEIPPNSSAYVYLEREVMTGNLTAPVSAMTYIDVKAGGKVIIPKGARLIGQCRRVNGDRVEMSFDGVIATDGREYAVDGIALGDDNLTGVAAIVNRNLPKKSGNLFASALLDSAAQTMNITGDSFSTIFAGNMADRTADSFNNVLDESASRSGATIRVPANTRFKILF